MKKGAGIEMEKREETERPTQAGQGNGPEDPLQELGIHGEEETTVLERPGRGKGERIAIIHRTGHLYAVPEDGQARILARFQVERYGLGACLDAARALTADIRKSGKHGKTCDTPGCNDPALKSVSIAPATSVSLCGECAGKAFAEA